MVWFQLLLRLLKLKKINKKVLAIIGLVGGAILLLDENNSEHLPKILKGTGLWLLIFGSSFSLIYSKKQVKILHFRSQQHKI